MPETITLRRQRRIHQAQAKFIQSNALFRGFVGGRGAGKTWVGAYDILRRARKGRTYLIASPTGVLLHDTTFPTFKALAQELGVWGPSTIEELPEIVITPTGEALVKMTPYPTVTLTTGATVRFRTAEDPEKLRGPNLSGVWLDEASIMEEDAFKIAIACLRESGQQGWLSATFTPKGRAHWTYKTFGTGKPDTEIFHAHTQDNPFNPPNFAATLAGKYTAHERRQELGGLFTDEGGELFRPSEWPRYMDCGDAFRIKDGINWRHCRKAEMNVLLALDWAYKGKKDSDHTAFVIAAMNNDGLLFILDVFNEQLRYEENAPALRDYCRKWRPDIVCGDDDSLTEGMNRDCRRFHEIPEIRRLPIKGDSKRVRAQAGIIRGENGLIYLPDIEQEWYDEMADVLVTFVGDDKTQDDIADCFGILGRLADEFNPRDVHNDDEPVFGAAGYRGLDAGGW